MAIENNGAVEVTQVKNGFMVTPRQSYRNGDFLPIEESMVFQSFAELSLWMSSHFSYRAQAIRVDA